MAFAGPTDVATAYEGSLPSGSEARVQYFLDTTSARLRVLLPDLVERIGSDPDLDEDLAMLAKDVVVQAVIGRLGGSTTQQVRSQTQAAGPWSTTTTYATDSTGTFSDQDLAALGGRTAIAVSGRVGTIKMGTLVDWHDQ
jgi:hypothetical protein